MLTKQDLERLQIEFTDSDLQRGIADMRLKKLADSYAAEVQEILSECDTPLYGRVELSFQKGAVHIAKCELNHRPLKES